MSKLSRFLIAQSTGVAATAPASINAAALLLNGSTQNLNIGNDVSIRLTDDFLYNAWVYPTSFSENKYIFSRYVLSGSQRALLFRMLSSSGYLGVVTSTNGVATATHSSTIAVPLNEWTMVSCRMTGGNLYLSKNDGTESSFSQSTLNTGSAQSYIGSFQGSGEMLAGSMASCKILNAGTDVRTELYNSGNPKLHSAYSTDITSNTAAAWELADEVPASGQEYDDQSSGGLNDATAISSPTFTGESIEFSTV